MVELLRELSNLNGVSGHENAVRNYIIAAVEPYSDSVRVDNMGNVIAFKKGRTGAKTKLIAAHTDEIGLIISGITDDGYLKFKAVGEVDTRHIIAKCVRIDSGIEGVGVVNGVLGMKAIHLQKREEREKTADISSLYIDIGAKNRKQAEKRVKLGDYAAFATEFEDAGGRVWGKALESRIGCACLIELMENDYDDDVYFAFTSQREVGMRGAYTAAYGLDIDEALVLEGTESADMYGAKPEETAAKLGGGVCVEFIDRYAIPDRRLTSELYNALKDAKIAAQEKKSARGLTDAGAFQRCAGGIKTACAAVPVRYAGTPACMAAKSDIEAMKQAAQLFVEGYGEKN
ncbi:MAG: M42 family peptidase [Firmicutes bacterium]|nr:M42 family peptidase [Bacillota bacterium]